MDGTDGYHDTHGCILEFWRRQIGTILKKWRRESAIARLSRLMISLSSRENSRHMIWFAFPDGGWTVSVALLVYTFESQSSKWESIKHHHQISLFFLFLLFHPIHHSLPALPFPHTHIFHTMSAEAMVFLFGVIIGAGLLFVKVFFVRQMNKCSSLCSCYPCTCSVTCSNPQHLANSLVWPFQWTLIGHLD